MTNRSTASFDKVRLSDRYNLHLRHAHASNVRRLHTPHSPHLTDAIFWSLDGDFQWRIAERHGTLPTGAALLVAAGAKLTLDSVARAKQKNRHARSSSTSRTPETSHHSGESFALLALSLQPSAVIDTAVRAGFIHADAHIAFRSDVIVDDKRLIHLGEDLRHELVGGATGGDVVIDALVERTIVHLLRHYADFRRSDELELSRVGIVDRRIRRAVELMHAHLDRELPLDELAAAAYLSSFHFARLFKKLTGTTPHAYLTALRTQRAQRLLAETDLSITEIGARVGYSGSSSFAKAFREATGLSPREFRVSVAREKAGIHDLAVP